MTQTSERVAEALGGLRRWRLRGAQHVWSLTRLRRFCCEKARGEAREGRVLRI